VVHYNHLKVILTMVNTLGSEYKKPRPVDDALDWTEDPEGSCGLDLGRFRTHARSRDRLARKPIQSVSPGRKGQKSANSEEQIHRRSENGYIRGAFRVLQARNVAGQMGEEISPSALLREGPFE
jgi:hypothetical protein